MISLARLFSLMKREAVLSAAAALALLSMLWVPPDGAYLSYVDWRTMAQLFCLMAVMAGLRELGVFSRLGRQLLRRVRSARQLECVLVFLWSFRLWLQTWGAWPPPSAIPRTCIFTPSPAGDWGIFWP